MIIDIFSNEQTYVEEYQTFCYQNCIRQILEYFNVKNAGFYINTSLSLILNREEDLNYNITYDDNARSVLPHYAEKVRRYYPVEKDKYEVWEDNFNKIKEGQPIITGVDPYYLEYMPYYNNSHGLHTLILAGLSEIEEEVYVVDWFEPWFYKGKVDFMSFIQARNSSNIDDGGIFSGYPINNNWAEIDNSGWNTDPLELIFLNLSLSIEQYYTCNKVENKQFKGISALRTIVEVLESVKDYDNNVKQVHLKKLYHSIFGSVKRKIFFKLFLTNAHRITNMDNFFNCKKLIIKIIDEWEDLLIVILRGVHRPDDETISKINIRLVNIIKQEEGLYDILVGLRNAL